MADIKTKSRLGRGLSSLISISAPSETDVAKGAALAVATMARDQEAAPVVPSIAPGTPAEIPVGQIVPNPHQPRRTINPAAIADLAASLKSNGVIQPIVVRKSTDGYELIAGERRWRAAQQAGFKNIPAIIRDVDRFTQAQMALVENIQREDLNPLDRAGGYRTIIEQLGLTQAELAQRLGEDRSTIANHLRLLDLAEPVRLLVKDGKLSLGHAKLLAGVSDKLEQERLANLVVTQDLSVRNLERAIQGSISEAPKTRAAVSTAYILDLEKSLARQLGLRVNFKPSRKSGKGKLVVHYNTLDEFDQLMKSLGVKPES
ncbi:MAG: ParB/RepB/Spo0J family partition protein [Tepidisphaeraceae bacterium]|jgi:ParB family chromosome partitioning protein